MNGQRIAAENLTSTTIDKCFGSNEYSIVGSLPKDEEIKQFQINMKAKNQSRFFCGTLPFPDETHKCITTVSEYKPAIWKQTPTELFMERFWATKRINYLMTKDDNVCTKGLSDFDNEPTISREIVDNFNEDSKECKEQEQDQ